MAQVLTHHSGARHPSSDPRLLTTNRRTVCRQTYQNGVRNEMSADPLAATRTKPLRPGKNPLDSDVPFTTACAERPQLRRFVLIDGGP